MIKLQELITILEEEKLMDKKVDFESRYFSAVRNKRIKDFLELETLQITDLTDLLENSGRLYAVRMDLNCDVDNHKKQVVAGLILRSVLRGKIPRSGIDTLIDGGNFNSAKALRHYTERLGMNGIYIMSRLFPQQIINMLESPNFQIIQAPKRDDVGIEREFYEYLIGLMANRDFRKNKFCLLHAKYGGRAMYPFGLEIAENLELVPDFVVSCLGAGGTLEGLQIPIQDYFKTPSIVIAEHELSPLFAKSFHYKPSLGSLPCIEREIKDIDLDFYEHINELPHIVIGPHYDEINPLLSKKAIARIDKVMQYSERDWMAMQKYLDQRGISVGNSSAANLSVAANLANQGNTVVTVFFEPFREFYKQQE